MTSLIGLVLAILPLVSWSMELRTATKIIPGDKTDNPATKLIILRENSDGEVELLLNVQDGSEQGENFDDSKRVKRITIVTDRILRLPKINCPTIWLEFTESILSGYKFEEPCVSSIGKENFLIVGDSINGLRADPIFGYEWICMNQILNGNALLRDSLDWGHVDWDFIHHFLGFKSNRNHGRETSTTGSPTRMKEDKYTQPATLFLFRFGPFGQSELMLLEGKHHYLQLPTCKNAKSKTIMRQFGLLIDPKTIVAKKKIHRGHQTILLCRADPQYDGLMKSSWFEQNSIIWHNFEGEIDKLSGALAPNTAEMVGNLDEQVGGKKGWMKILKMLNVSGHTHSFNQFESRHHHQYHDHHHHHTLPILHPHNHQHHGKEYLVAVWKGTQSCLSFGKPKSVKVLPAGINPHHYHSDGKVFLNWDVLVTSDVLNVVESFSKDVKVLVVTMLDLENPFHLVKCGVDCLPAELLRRTNLSTGVGLIAKEMSKQSVFYMSKIRSIRLSSSSGYAFTKGDCFGIAVVGQFHEVERHHGKLVEKDMERLVAKLSCALWAAVDEEYEIVVVSIGRHEWEGLHTHTVLDALQSAAMNVIDEKLKIRIVIALDSCFNEEDRSSIKEYLDENRI